MKILDLFCGGGGRHRKFESNMELTSLECRHKEQGRPVGVYGSMNDAIEKEMQ